MDAQQRFTSERVAHWEQVAASSDTWRGLGGAYHERLQRVYQRLIPPGQRVLEVGCGRGDLLAACRPALGVGVDFSRGFVRRARAAHPECRFIQAEAHCLPLGGKFDAVILSDLANDLWDVQQVLQDVRRLMHRRSRILLNFYSRLWEQPLAIAEKAGVARPVLHQNWLAIEDMDNLLSLSGFEVLRAWREYLWPLRLPGVDAFFNRVVVRLWPFYHLAMSNFILARPDPYLVPERRAASVSIIVPARNESGNIGALLQRLPRMAAQQEVIFVEGHSRDSTFETIRDELPRHPEVDGKLLRQSGVGKGNAVRDGFAQASGEALIILDADLSVRPEDLPRFYEALVSGVADLANGVRLVYPMEGEAMRFLNLIGNKMFSYLFSWMLGQPIKDTLCGTKALWKADYLRIAAGREAFGDFDPFGDYDLLLGAAKIGLRILDIPIRYQQRVYGRTNIDRWRHGWVLLRMVVFAARRLKFT